MSQTTADDNLDATPPRRINLAAMSSALSLIVIIAAFWAFFSWRQPGFLSSFNLLTLGRALAIDIVIGFAQMVVLATGGMNLAVGAIGVCTVMAGGTMMQVLGLPAPVAILGALAPGAALGLINGFAITSIVLNLPTIQTIYLQATLRQDVFLASTILVMIAITVVVGNLISDVLLAWIDPRIRYD